MGCPTGWLGGAIATPEALPEQTEIANRFPDVALMLVEIGGGDGVRWMVVVVKKKNDNKPC